MLAGPLADGVAPMHRSWPVRTKAGSRDKSRPAVVESSNCYTRTMALATPTAKVFGTGYSGLSNLSTTISPRRRSCNEVPNHRGRTSALNVSTAPLHPNGLVGYNGRINFVEGGGT